MKTKKLLFQKAGRHPVVCSLLIAGAALFSLDGGFRAAALSFPTTPEASANQITFACFEVAVDSDMQWILNPGASPYTSAYPGWTPPYLVSPGLNDSAANYGSDGNNTEIGES